MRHKGKRGKAGGHFSDPIPLSNQTARRHAHTRSTTRTGFPLGLTPNLRYVYIKYIHLYICIYIYIYTCICERPIHKGLCSSRQKIDNMTNAEQPRASPSGAVLGWGAIPTKWRRGETIENGPFFGNQAEPSDPKNHLLKQLERHHKNWASISSRRKAHPKVITSPKMSARSALCGWLLWQTLSEYRLRNLELSGWG